LNPTMNSKTFPSIPPDTAKAARAVFGRSNFYLAAGDQVDHLFGGLVLEDPSRRLHQLPRTLAMLYLITIFQYVETLPDQLAVDALRKRIDWKYALHLPLSHPGLEAAALCEFRRWLLVDQTGQKNLQTLLSRLSEVTGFPSKRPTSLESCQVILTVCQISRLAKIWEAFNQAMQSLATRRPEWLLAASLPHWYERYSQPHRYLNFKTGNQEKHSLAQAIGADGIYLLEAVSNADDPELAEGDEIRALREVWREQFEFTEGKVSWRKEVCAGCSLPDILSNPIQRANYDQ